MNKINKNPLVVFFQIRNNILLTKTDMNSVKKINRI